LFRTTARVGALSVVSAEKACEKGTKSKIKNEHRIAFIIIFHELRD
jgi:hypothetical protein